MLSCAEDKSPKPYERYKYSGVELEYPKYITCQQVHMLKKKNNVWLVSTIKLVEKYETAN